MSKFLDYDSIFVVYPGGTGGNHVRNLISTCPGILDNTKPDMKALYEKHYTEIHRRKDTGAEISAWDFVAHFNDITITEYIDNPEIFKEFIEYKGVNVLFGHESAYQHLSQTELLTPLLEARRVIWIVLTWPSTGGIAAKRQERLVTLNLLTLRDQQSHEKYQFPYYPSRFLDQKVDDSNGILLDTDRLFTETGSQYLRQLLLENFNLELPEEADHMHKLWFSGILATIDKYSL